MKFDVTTKLSLAFLGEGWEECSITYSAISVKEAKKLTKLGEDPSELFDAGLELLSKKFVSGKALSEGKIVDMKVEYIEDLPLSVIKNSIEALTESEDTKKA